MQKQKKDNEEKEIRTKSRKEERKKKRKKRKEEDMRAEERRANIRKVQSTITLKKLTKRQGNMKNKAALQNKQC
ncbi:hypothetical protein [Paenibacillus massiliensis]|uniref:hypothetical protein n=1 Tax=Paenibacillus massiliensis TaxID=225917 RepID=UPI000472A110|nr:hypothetical protein [Paenibacillus massiliensis]